LASFRIAVIAGFTISTLILLPCVWHRASKQGICEPRIHTWLAQLIAKGQRRVCTSRSNGKHLFDLMMLARRILWDLLPAENRRFRLRRVFSGGVSRSSRGHRTPAVLLTPCIAMLAYGYSISMRISNYISLPSESYSLRFLAEGIAVSQHGDAWRKQHGAVLWPRE